MKLNLKVTMTDGTSHDVTTGVPDVVAWEMKFDTKISQWGDGIGLRDMTFLAWNALSRAKETPLKYELWLDRVESIEAADADPKSTPKEA